MPDNPVASTQIRASAAIVGAQRQNPRCAVLTDEVVAELPRRGADRALADVASAIGTLLANAATDARDEGGFREVFHVAKGGQLTRAEGNAGRP